MGLGIVAMHYIGMETLRACTQMVNSTPLVMAAGAVAIAASGLALWLAFGGASHSLPISATVLGIAISGMHYTAMAGLSLTPRAGARRPQRRYRPICSPSSSRSSRSWFPAAFCCRSRPSAADVRSGLRPRRSPRRQARRLNRSFPRSARFRPRAAREGRRRRPASHIPVERNGSTWYVPTPTIVAVRADAHYTHVYDGAASYFCSLSIGEIEQRLDPLLFARVHRSHIVNIARVDAARFNSDNGTIELEGEERYSVPVSRSRIGQIKARLSGLGRAAE